MRPRFEPAKLKKPALQVCSKQAFLCFVEIFLQTFEIQAPTHVAYGEVLQHFFIARGYHITLHGAVFFFFCKTPSIGFGTRMLTYTGRLITCPVNFNVYFHRKLIAIQMPHFVANKLNYIGGILVT